MSNRWLAPLFVGMAVTLGWLWRICHELNLAVEPLCYVGLASMALWLWARLERMRKQEPTDSETTERTTNDDVS